MSRFTGKVVAVTGAAGGIGAATARCLASEGAAVALIDLPAWIIATSTAPIPNAGLAMDAAKPTATTKQNVPSAASASGAQTPRSSALATGATASNDRRTAAGR